MAANFVLFPLGPYGFGSEFDNTASGILQPWWYTYFFQFLFDNRIFRDILKYTFFITATFIIPACMYGGYMIYWSTLA